MISSFPVVSIIYITTRHYWLGRFCYHPIFSVPPNASINDKGECHLLSALRGTWNQVLFPSHFSQRRFVPPIEHRANKILSISLFSTSLCLQPLHSNQKSSHTLRYALLRHPPSVGSLWKRTTSSSIDYRLTTERVLSTITAGVLTLCLVWKGVVDDTVLFLCSFSFVSQLFRISCFLW